MFAEQTVFAGDVVMALLTLERNVMKENSTLINPAEA